MIRRRVAGWAESGRAVGGALVEVWRAELAALRRDLESSGRQFWIVLVLGGVAAGLLFWTLGLGLWLAVEALALRLERWQAVGVVFGVGALVTVALFWVAGRRLRRIEPPLATIDRHRREHVDWWRQTVLPELDPRPTSDDVPEDDEPEFV